MFGLKTSVTVAIVLSLVIGFQYLLLEKKDITIDQLTLDVKTLNESIAKLEDSLKEQGEVVSGLIELSNEQEEAQSALIGKYEEANSQAQEAQRVIDQLRLTEAVRVLENPYAHGDDARERLTNIMLRISASSTTGKSIHQAGITKKLPSNDSNNGTDILAASGGDNSN